MNPSPTTTGRRCSFSQLAERAIRIQLLTTRLEGAFAVNPAAVNKVVDSMYRAVRKFPKTERVLFIPLTKRQSLDYHRTHGTPHLSRFLAKASLEQLFSLVGATPMVWDVNEDSNGDARPVRLLAIVDPTPDELRAYGLTPAKASHRRALVKAETDRRVAALSVPQRKGETNPDY